MASVTVNINRRDIRMACDDGEEGYVLELAKRLDQEISTLRGSFGEIGELRLIIMAAIRITDELETSKKKVESLEGQVNSLRDGQLAVIEGFENSESLVGNRLDEMADQIERLAAQLSGTSKKS